LSCSNYFDFGQLHIFHLALTALEKLPSVFSDVWFFWSTSLFSGVEDTAGSPCVLPATVMEAAISPTDCGSFYQRTVEIEI
jgi:hypothetical protein